MTRSQPSPPLPADRRDFRRLGLWELTEPLRRMVRQGIADDVPSAEARAVWCFDASSPSSGKLYQEADPITRRVRLYHPAAFWGDVRAAVLAFDAGEPGSSGTPRYAAGDRVYAAFNAQSGRWEILGPGEDLWRFELKTTLTHSADRDVPATAEAWLVIYDAVQGRYVRTSVQFHVADFLGHPTAPPGTRGYARRMADSAEVGWEVLQVEER